MFCFCFSLSFVSTMVARVFRSFFIGCTRQQYSGTNAEFTKADTVIFRTDLYNMTTGRKEYNFKRTLKYDSKWLDSKYSTALFFSSLILRYCFWFRSHFCPQLGLASVLFVSFSFFLFVESTFDNVGGMGANSDFKLMLRYFHLVAW